jgi:hypothetical protein
MTHEMVAFSPSESIELARELDRIIRDDMSVSGFVGFKKRSNELLEYAHRAYDGFPEMKVYQIQMAKLFVLDIPTGQMSTPLKSGIGALVYSPGNIILFLSALFQFTIQVNLNGSRLNFVTVFSTISAIFLLWVVFSGDASPRAINKKIINTLDLLRLIVEQKSLTP